MDQLKLAIGDLVYWHNDQMLQATDRCYHRVFRLLSDESCEDNSGRRYPVGLRVWQTRVGNALGVVKCPTLKLLWF